MKKKVLMRKNNKRLNTIQLIAKRLNITQIVEHLEIYSVKDLEVAYEEYQKTYPGYKKRMRGK